MHLLWRGVQGHGAFFYSSSPSQLSPPAAGEPVGASVNSVCTHSHQGLDTVSHADGVAGLSQDTFHAALATATGVSWAPSAGFRAQLYIARPVILLPSPVAVMRFKCSSTATAPLY